MSSAVSSTSPSGVEDFFSVCIAGAGAIGCHLAFLLLRAGCRVTLLARGENLARLRREGLCIRVEGELHQLPIRATDLPEEVGPVDYVFCTVKVSSWNSDFVEHLEPLLRPETTVIPPTTSIPHWWFHGVEGAWKGRALASADPAGTIARLIPADRVLGMTMWVSARRDNDVVEVVNTQRGYPLGELDGSVSRRLRRLSNALERGGGLAPVVTEIRAEIFIKVVNSLTFNVVALLGNVGNGMIADSPEAVKTLTAMMLECEKVASVLGLPLRQSAESRIRQTLQARAHVMSMLHDFRRGKPLELQPLWRSFEELAQVVGVQLPITSALVSVATRISKSRSIHALTTR